MKYTAAGNQTTLGDRIDLTGVGVHSGKPVSISLLPADVDTGIVFQRSDVDVEDQHDIPALVSSVGATDLCTVLGDPAGVNVKTVEHLMAALMGMGIDNVLVEVDSAEIPVMDGSSEVFVNAFAAVGVKTQTRRRRYLRILKEVRFDMGPCWGMFVPHDGTRYEVEIDFDEPIIGRQKFDFDLTPETFRTEISRARTFGFMKDVERYWAAGFALGSSLENSVVIADDDTIINPEGLRYENEFVRHKALDAIGDLALAGAPILGCYKSYRGGHKVNAMALAALLADPTAYELTNVEEPARRASTKMTNRSAGAASVSAAAYAADKS